MIVSISPIRYNTKQSIFVHYGMRGRFFNGYKYDKKTKTFPVFINYDKSEDISDTTKYEDHFVEGFRNRLIAISKSGRSLKSEDVQNFLKAKERDIKVELFVRKNKDDKISKEFYYLGHMTASGNTKEVTMADTEIKVGDLIDTIEYDYPTFHLSMDCFWAEVIAGHLELKEAETAKWLTRNQLDSVAWLPADVIR